MTKEICNIIYGEQERHAYLELIENEDNVEIMFRFEELILRKSGDNYFETLIEIRKELEKRNIKLLCKGCCRNVYPSGMILSMGLGRSAYTLIYGKQAKMNSIVDIFEACSIEEYATIKQQLEYFEGWIDSIGG